MAPKITFYRALLALLAIGVAAVNGIPHLQLTGDVLTAFSASGVWYSDFLDVLTLKPVAELAENHQQVANILLWCLVAVATGDTIRKFELIERVKQAI